MKSFNDIKNTLVEEKASIVSEELWKQWKSLINVSPDAHSAFLKSTEGKTSALKKGETDSSSKFHEISRDLSNMIETGDTYEKAKNWPLKYWMNCQVQVEKINNLRKMRKRMVGNPFEREGKMTKWLKTLLFWGNDPSLPLNK